MNAPAVQALKQAGISQRSWALTSWPDAVWRGDECGCPDDRCIGRHHDEHEDCPCLAALIENFLKEKVSAHG